MKRVFTHPIRNRHLFASDLILLTIAAYLSYVLRLETYALGAHWSGFLLLTGLTLLILPLVFRRAGIYARYWRYASVEEILLLAGAVTVGVALAGGSAGRMAGPNASIPPAFHPADLPAAGAGRHGRAALRHPTVGTTR